MPEFVTLYSYNPNPFTLRTVIRSTLDPTFIDYTDYATGGTAPQPPDGSILAIVCQPGTFDRYTYKVSTLSPFATYTVETNSTFCGYVPPACDIRELTFEVTDETSPGANDGTVNLFCTSSFGPITYYMSPPLPDPPQTNTTGYFTGLKPGTSYYINATDTNACEIHHDFIIRPFSEDYTHYKYRLIFKSGDGSIEWELQLYDMKHAYLKTEYPKDIEGGEDPVVWTTSDQQEDKFTPIITHQLDIQLLFDRTLFTVEEFATVSEQTWYVQLVSTDIIYFKGYLLPDETGDEYSDPPYIITLKATDGIPSLKGNKWGNGSGGQGYGSLQIQQYGLALWAELIKQCLDQLRYDYGDIHIVSSLQYNALFSSGLWLNISTWSDILYDSSGVPVSTYDALSLLLKAMKLSIVQEKGEFRLINWNDLYYINTPLVATKFAQCFYRIFSGLTGIVTEDQNINYQIIGFDSPLSPCNPPQGFNFDKPYNIENDVKFDILALLYENPSFEIGAVQGELPPGWVKNSGANIVAYCQYNPVTEDINSGALDGSWELRIEGADGTRDNYIQYGPIPIDQSNKLINVSLGWRSSDSTIFEFDGHPLGFVFSMAIIYHDSTSGNFWFLQNSPNPALSFADWNSSTNRDFPPQPSSPAWSLYNTSWTSEGNGAGLGPSGLKPLPTTDFIGWQSYSITSPVLPESQIGDLYIRIFPTRLQLYDRQYWPQVPHHFNDGMYTDMGGSLPQYYVAIDKLDITLSDAANQYNLQTGEKHITTIATGLPPANVKQDDLKLFTYPNNKRVAGNVFHGPDYDTGTVANKWNFALKSLDPQDRLPAAITRAYSRQYKQPMYKWEGSVEAPYMTYYAVYGLRFYDGKLFMPFKIERHLRTDINNVTLIEISDDDVQATYTYTPEYERSARNQ